MLEEGLASSVRDAMEQPLGDVYEIMGLRNYARMRQAIEKATAAGKTPPEGHTADLYWAVQKELVDEARALRAAKEVEAPK